MQITTTKGDVFTGTLLPMYFVIQDNNEISVEFYLSQHESHKGLPFGTVGLTVRDVKSIIPC
ncbi:hypothetical protein SAMN02910417_02031 [Eubacterium oxidoreducens]|uniref:Uncharacterized protein n=1 Tax=Eubacterium oxidoreducens TaxID=1732 RepID=A0A1G6C3Q5_EUBOX|nr:hypothetical protein SAMN02910417_02031 [Eubacterium oxidoreducens]